MYGMVAMIVSASGATKGWTGRLRMGGQMKYDVDYDYEYEVNEAGLNIIPEGTTHDGELYVLPNGRYMPSGVYFDPKSGLDVIYEPSELSPFQEMLESLPTQSTASRWATPWACRTSSSPAGPSRARGWSATARTTSRRAPGATTPA